LDAEIFATVAAVLVGGVLAQWAGWRLRVPAIVFLLLVGLIAGPITGVLEPGRVFGDLLFPMVSLAVAVILFEGALDLGWSGVRHAGRTVWTLISVGAVLGIAGASVAGRYVLDIEWDLAILLATILAVTGPTVIGPIVRSIGLRGRAAQVLQAEATLIDPLGAVLAVIVFEALFASTEGHGSVATNLALTVVAGTAIGVGVAFLVIVALSRRVLPDHLDNPAVLAAVLAAFAAADAVREEAGLVAVTAMGIALAAQQRVVVRHVLAFNETLRIIFVSGLFILLGAAIDATTLGSLEWRNIVFLALLVVVVRPLAVSISTIRSPLSWQERVFVAFTAPRGIVAAAVASVFGLALEKQGFAESQVLVSATFTVIIGTVLLSGLGSRALAVRLGLVDPNRSTIVVLGANRLGRELARSLQQHDAPVTVIDIDRANLTAARMEGIGTYSGTVLAEDTWDSVDLEHAAAFLAVTPNDELNALAVRHAGAVLGRSHVFQTVPHRPEHRRWSALPVGAFGQPLFTPAVDTPTLEARLADAWQVHSTKVTEHYTADDYERDHVDRVVLFVVDARGRVRVATPDKKQRLGTGDVVVAIVPTGNGAVAPPR
jgi:NhaP-type Na+/H+ or K+/H+ antiporter